MNKRNSRKRQKTDEKATQTNTFISDDEYEFDEDMFDDIIDPYSKNHINSKKENIKTKINSSFFNIKTKQVLINRLNDCYLDDKMTNWFDSILRFPVNKFSKINIDTNKKNKVKKYFIDLKNKLDKTVYGLSNVKKEIINYVAQSISNKNASPRIIGLHGPPGTGKTKIVRDCISSILNKPLKTFSMGGIKDSQYLNGFNYTYIGSKYGAIISSIIDAGVMNPIFFFDELDKISTTGEGKEIEDLLIHITDVNQNFDFNDKYFDGIGFDLSKCMFIFAFNNIENISPVLLDRIHVIKILPPTNDEKLIIVKDYILDELTKNVIVDKNTFKITDEAIRYLVNITTKNEGLRLIKRYIESILLDINCYNLLGDQSDDLLKIKMNKKNDVIIIDENDVKKLFNNKNDDEVNYSMYM